MTALTEHRSPDADGTGVPPRRRPAPTALTAATLALLLGGVGGYGSVYFTGLEGWDAMGATYVAVYLWIAGTGVAAAVAFLRGHRLGHAGMVWFGAWAVVFTVFKMASIQEWEASVFGAVGLVLLVLVTRPSARKHLRR